MAKAIALPLEQIIWNVDLPVEEAEVFPINPDEEPHLLRPDELATVVLPGNDFKIIFPFARYEEIEQIIPYAAEGQPVTLHDLLLTIYLFYQEPIPANELRKLKQTTRTFGIDEDIYDNVVKRIDAMYGLVHFEGLILETPNVYSLHLGS